MQGVVYLLARWLRYARAHTHSRAGLVHTQTMDFLMEGPLTLFLHTKSILFIPVQSPTRSVLRITSIQPLQSLSV